VEALDQFDGRRRVVDSALGQRVGDDDTRSVDAQMGASSSRASRLRHASPWPLAFAHDRQSCAVDDQMQALARRDSSTREVEMLATP